MELIGKTTINPLLFYSGKICGYIAWCILAVSIITKRNEIQFDPLESAAFILLGVGLLFTAISLVNLGKSTRLGLPAEQTELKTNGLYKWSRNPMYLGFNMLTLSAILFLQTPVIIVLGVYSMIVYHLIIRAEEKFLERCFKDDYSEYKHKVRRYI